LVASYSHHTANRYPVKPHDNTLAVRHPLGSTRAVLYNIGEMKPTYGIAVFIVGVAALGISLWVVHSRSAPISGPPAKSEQPKPSTQTTPATKGPAPDPESPKQVPSAQPVPSARELLRQINDRRLAELHSKRAALVQQVKSEQSFADRLERASDPIAAGIGVERDPIIAGQLNEARNHIAQLVVEIQYIDTEIIARTVQAEQSGSDRE